MSERRGTIHILSNGHAICGAMSFPPNTWPAGNWWVGATEVRAARGDVDELLDDGQTWCSECLKLAPEFM